MAKNTIGTRTSKSKKKKANLIYNILLGVVIIAIVIVGAAIFLGNDEDNSATETERSTDQQVETDSEEKENVQKDEEQAVIEEEENVENESQSDEQAEDDGAPMEEETGTEEGTESTEDEDGGTENAGNGNWEPVGTQQTGEHTTNFTKGSVDWNEMEKALAYGAGIDQSDMTVWFLGNGGAPDKASGTISSKSSGTKYKVNIQWVDGQGWKPTSVEQVN